MKNRARRIISTVAATTALLFSTAVGFAATEREQAPFTWNNALVYFVLTDRFYDGDPTNNNSYGRPQKDAWGTNIATFHGGDVAGLTKKLEEGYFKDLGVNAIWISAPIEQSHGWVGGGNDGSFAHYAYHGYYALDWTMIDKNMGTIEQMRKFVDTAHEQGIRVILDVVLNHTGYENLQDMADYGYGKTKGIDATWTPNKNQGQTWHSHNDLYDLSDAGAWGKWWGSSWIRNSKPGYTAGGGDDLTKNLDFLPDIKTEVRNSVGLPPILQTKWGKEASGYDNWIVPAAKGLRKDLGIAPTDYTIKWMAAWVEEFGIDGFRCDTAKHVEMDRWNQLKQTANAALTKWRQNNPNKPGAQWDEPFWMTGETWGWTIGAGKDQHFTSGGFDSMINFAYTGAKEGNYEGTFSEYAGKVNNGGGFNVLSYISSHDTSLGRGNMVDIGTKMLLMPGGVQIFYGDETARQPGPGPKEMPTRSFMNWGSYDQNLLSHWQKIGSFRYNNPAVGAGQHKKIADSPYTFSRTYKSGDIDNKVVVAIGASGTASIDVSSVFPDGTPVRDAYTGKTATVSGGKASFAVGSTGVVLIEQSGPVDPTIPVINPDKPGGVVKGNGPGTITTTVTLKNASTGKYTLDGSDPAVSGKDFKSGDVITVGSNLAHEQTVTLKVYAKSDTTDKTASGTYTFTYQDNDVIPKALRVQFKKTEGWGEPYLYAYQGEGATAKSNAAWPGAKMTDIGNGLYEVTLPDGWQNANIIFYSTTKRDPADKLPGLPITGSVKYENGVLTPLVTTKAVTGVTLSPKTVSIKKGETTSLTATIAPADATNKEVTWSSSNPAVATVSSNGTVTAVAKGQAIITVTTKDGAKTDTATVEVTEVAPVVVQLELGDVAGKVGDTITVPVAVKNVGTIGAFDMWLKYDTNALEFVKVLENFGAEVSATGDKVKIAKADANGIILFGDELLSVQFKIKNTDLKSTTVSLVEQEGTDYELAFYNTEENKYTLQPKNSQITITGTIVPPVTLGDINEDGQINSADALMAAQIGLGKINATADQRTRADVNKDGRVNSLDALRIIRAALGFIKL